MKKLKSILSNRNTVTFIGIIFLPLFPYLVKSYTIGKEEVESGKPNVRRSKRLFPRQRGNYLWKRLFLKIH